MIVIIQRVKQASVSVDQHIVANITHGFLLLLGIEQNDTPHDTLTLVSKISKLRVFPDADYKMNLSIHDVKGSILLVSQFTLCADTKRGNRPSFVRAMQPDVAKNMYLQFGNELEKLKIPVQYGQFGAAMHVNLVNEGPVTIILESANGELKS